MHDQVLINWLNLIGSSKNTRELYITIMRKYCELTRLTPTQLIDQVEKESILPIRQQSVFAHIGNFKKHIHEKLTPTSRVTYLAAVSSFYSMYDVPLSKKLLKQDSKPTIQISNDLSIDLDIVTKAFTISPQLMKLIIAVQFTSGFSMTDILNLKVGTFRENIKNNIACLKQKRQKTGIDYYTFLSPTAVSLATNQIEQLKLADDDYLICLEKGMQLRENQFLELYRQASRDLGFKQPGYRGYNKFHSHNLRKLFYNVLLKNGGWEMISFAEYLMGHKVPDTRKAYFKADIEGLRAEYARFVPFFEETLSGVDDGKKYS